MICSMLRLAHVAVVILGHHAQVNVHAEEVAAFARNEQDGSAVMRLDGALGANVGEVGDGEDVHDTPGVVGLVPGHGAADRRADLAASTVAAHHVLGVHGPLCARVRAGAAHQRDLDRVLALVGDLQALEIPTKIRGHAGWASMPRLRQSSRARVPG